jgi:hypothetical protein
VRDDQDFRASVSNRLRHCLVDVEALDGLDLKMKCRQVRANMCS